MQQDFEKKKKKQTDKENRRDRAHRFSKVNQ